MVDIREQILVRILEVLTSMDDIEAAYRNRAEFPSTKMPLAVVLDGVERSVTQTRGRGRLPAIVRLLPQIFIIIKPRTDANNEGAGEELSLLRVHVLAALNTDQQLAVLLGENGSIDYLGCETDMQTGSSMEGQMKIDLAFEYMLDMSDLS